MPDAEAFDVPTVSPIDRHGRLVLMPSKVELEDLFRHRPKVERVMGAEGMACMIGRHPCHHVGVHHDQGRP